MIKKVPLCEAFRVRSLSGFLSTWREPLLAVLCLLAWGQLRSDAVASDANAISLAGDWRFRLDHKDVGLEQRWFERRLADGIRLPGCLPEQGIGDDVSVATKWTGDVKYPQWYKDPLYAEFATPDDFRFPFWLQPNKYYTGAVWYQHEFEVPADWRSKRVVLTLERPHWESHVWVDGQKIGSNDSLSTPHAYELGTSLSPGKHQLTIRVDNRVVVDVGINSHSISDHTQGNWNGIVGRLDVAATDPIWIEDLQVYASTTEKQAEVRFKIANATKQPSEGTITLEVEPTGDSEPSGVAPVQREISIPPDGAAISIRVPLGDDIRLWDEFSPTLYRLRARLQADTFKHERDIIFGIRDISADATQFLLNGRKTFFRGTLECAVFPKTGFPPTDIEAWRRIVRICKDHGLNMIRFHSWCPPEAAFRAADELGFYYQVEAASWANQSTTLGDGKPVDQWIERETERILEAYGNHPSFVLMTYGNEPGGPAQERYLTNWVNHNRKQDPRRLYSSASGWPQIDANQFHVTPDPRIQEWGAGLNSRINGKPPETRTDYREYIGQRPVPVISHEIGQWCVFPNFEEMPKYTGYLKPKNFAIFRDTLAAHHIGDQARDFLMASGKLQTLCYKEDIESALRTPGMGGFQLLGLNDFPGQGTALVGVVDAFWDTKGYVSPAEFRRFCDETVLLARLDKRVFTSDEIVEADLEVAHFGAAPIENAIVRWRLVNADDDAVAEGKLPSQTVPVDNGVELGPIAVPLEGLQSPAKYRLVVNIADTPYENDWDIWVYPSRQLAEPPGDVLIVSELHEDALARLGQGGKVLLMVPPSRVKGDSRGKVGLGFSSIFWNTAWTDRQLPHTLGILCDPKHPLFEQFPTEFHSNWQWWYLVTQGGAMILDGLPHDLRPLVQVIDDWVTNRRLGLAFEAKIGRGKLLVCSIDLEQGLEADPVRRQFRHSLLAYMRSDQFAPQHEVTLDQVRALIAPPSAMDLLGVVAVIADSAEVGHEAYQAIDDNPQTIWHTQWRARGPALPHSLQVEFKAPLAVGGFTVLPRQDNVRNGWINDYLFYASDDGKDWGQPIAHGSFSANKDLKKVELPNPVTARFFRLVATSGFDSLPYTSIAEFAVVPAN